MMGYLAAHEREMASHRTRSALEHKARKGLVVGGSVYGYRNERTSEPLLVGQEFENPHELRAFVRGLGLGLAA